MTLEEFFNAIDAEGFDYAFSEWGLSSKHLPEDAPEDLRIFVNEIVSLYERLEDLASVIEDFDPREA